MARLDQHRQRVGKGRLHLVGVEQLVLGAQDDLAEAPVQRSARTLGVVALALVILRDEDWRPAA
ncbi:MAG: hypothetical protein U1F43_30145 [Myxococcota bacterium]